ncbi:MAG: helix-turn-helix domain-containing protein [Burkholderiaceae bacterium]
MGFLITATEQLGPTLKGLRRAARLTQTQVARAGGLRQKTVSMLENEPKRCTVESLIRYLAAVGTPLNLEQSHSSQSHSRAQAPW